MAREKVTCSGMLELDAEVVWTWASRSGAVFERCRECSLACLACSLHLSATESSESGLLSLSRWRANDGGSEAKESRIPAILKRSVPRILRRAKIIGR